MVQWIKRFFRNLISTIWWLPFIWKDRHWDYSYLFYILEHKFKLMENYFRKEGIRADVKEQARRIKVCKLLCKRIHEQNYTNPYEERNKAHFDWFCKKMTESFSKEPNKDGLITIIEFDEPDEPENRWVLSAAEHEDMLLEQDIDLLCKMIKKYCREWWD